MAHDKKKSKKETVPDSLDPAVMPVHPAKVTHPAGSRIDWIRVKYTPGPASDLDLLFFGRLGRSIDGTLEAILHDDEQPIEDGAEPPEIGTIYVQRDKVYEIGYETSFVHRQRQCSPGSATSGGAEPEAAGSTGSSGSDRG